MTTSLLPGYLNIDGLIGSSKVEGFGGFMDGQGKWLDPITGDHWDGLWVNGTITYGKLTKRNGIKYIGDFKDTKPSGKGTILWPNEYKFEGYHKNFDLEEGEMFFPDGERHEGIWTNNVPGRDGIRKYPNGGRSKGPIHSMQLSSGLQRYRVILKITGEKRVFEIWNGSKHIRESVEGIIPKESLDLEASFLNACAKGELKEVVRILEKAPLLSRFGYEIYTENNTLYINPALLLAVERNQSQIVKHLLVVGADIATVNSNMDNAFHIATKHGNHEILEILCEMTINYDEMDVHPLDFKDKDGFTPLGLGWKLYDDGIKKRMIDQDKVLEKCIRLLMRYGADPGETVTQSHVQYGLSFMTIFNTPKLDSIVHRYEREYRKIPTNLSQKKRRELASSSSIWCFLGF